MATDSRTAFETSLDDLDVPVSFVDRSSVPDRIDDLAAAPAVGVSLAAAFDDPALSLADTAVDVDPTPAALRAATTGVTDATIGIGDYGTVVVPGSDRASELVSLFVERHVAVLRERDLVADMETAIESLDEELTETRGSVVLATGPSATADMGELVKGAHGPREVHVVVVEGA